MATKKPLDLSGLVATKGSATPLAEMPSRTADRSTATRAAPSPRTTRQVKSTPVSEPRPLLPAADHDVDEDAPEGGGINNLPLNFRVSADLRRRFRMYAAAHDLKLNELFRLSFEAYERQTR